MFVQLDNAEAMQMNATLKRFINYVTPSESTQEGLKAGCLVMIFGLSLIQAQEIDKLKRSQIHQNEQCSHKNHVVVPRSQLL